jgi:hypothetical protein
MLCDKEGYNVLHRAANNAATLKLLLHCLPEAKRVDAVMECHQNEYTVLQEAVHSPESLEQILDSLPEAARAGVILANNDCGDSVLDIAKYLDLDQSKRLLEAVLEQAKKRTANQTSQDSTVPNHDAGSGLSTPASSSDIGTSAPLGSHSFFSQGSVTPPDPVSPGVQSTFKK